MAGGAAAGGAGLEEEVPEGAKQEGSVKWGEAGLGEEDGRGRVRLERGVERQQMVVGLFEPCQACCRCCCCCCDGGVGVGCCRSAARLVQWSAGHGLREILACAGGVELEQVVVVVQRGFFELSKVLEQGTGLLLLLWLCLRLRLLGRSFLRSGKRSRGRETGFGSGRRCRCLGRQQVRGEVEQCEFEVPHSVIFGQGGERFASQSQRAHVGQRGVLHHREPYG